MRERKRLIRLIVTDVTLIKGDEHITAHVRLSGGVTHTLREPRPLQAWETHSTLPTTITLIDELLADHPYDEAVTILNNRGLTGGWGKPFSVPSLTQLCRLRDIPNFRQRFQAAGMLTIDKITAELGVAAPTIKKWQQRGHITGRRVDGRCECLYYPGQIRPSDGRSTRWHRSDVTTMGDDDHQPAESNSITISQGGAV